jgi:hypothetical protein
MTPRSADNRLSDGRWAYAVATGQLLEGDAGLRSIAPRLEHLVRLEPVVMAALGSAVVYVIMLAAAPVMTRVLTQAVVTCVADVRALGDGSEKQLVDPSMRQNCHARLGMEDAIEAIAAAPTLPNPNPAIVRATLIDRGPEPRLSWRREPGLPLGHAPGGAAARSAGASKAVGVRLEVIEGQGQRLSRELGDPAGWKQSGRALAS